VRMTSGVGRCPARLSLLGRAWPRPILLLLLLAPAVSAQTLQQAETLWKARRFKDAFNVFTALEDKYPDNPDIKARLGRLLLERNQPDDANAEFNKALAIKKDHAGALLGEALLAADLYDAGAAELARKALESDPKLAEAQELLARLALEDNNNPKAIEDANKALALDPNSVQAKAILATMDWLADKKDTQWDPHAAKGYETAGHFFTLNRRYVEADQYYRKAIEMDPYLDSAKAQLGINLMRLGSHDEAYQLLKGCWDGGYQSKAISNSLLLMDKYFTRGHFTTFQTPRTVLMVDKKEADLLHPYFESEMQRAIATYEKKYKFKLDHPVQVEVYPDHDDFAVRTLGMPGLGALGVTFVYSVAMDSPSGRKPGEFHWASTMWHELSHVYTLTMSNHRVPRWFTEGLAVHEETAVSPEWGDRLGLDELTAIKDHKLLPVAELDRGFIHPKSSSQVVVSYFQAGRICDYINKKWGWDTLLAMLHDFGNDDDTPTVIRKELKIEPQEFDKEFLASLEAETKNVVDHFDEWKKGVKQIAESLKNKDYSDVIKEGTRIRDFYPDYVEEHSVYEMLAQAYIAKGDKTAAIAELERYVKAGGRNPDGIQQAAKLLQEAGNLKEAAAVLERLNYIYPLVNAAHESLGDLWFGQGNATGAIREFAAVVAHHPLDPAKAHYDLARAYHLNHEEEQAKDELLAALETAPGYRQAQKLLLELSESGTQHDTVKK
jgi:tetratricopeptide (TPR) repeat protein